jgi:hypothetical protein
MKRYRWRRWLFTSGVALVLAVVGGPFLYIHFIVGSAPAPLTLSSASPSSGSEGTATSSTGSTDGTWNVTKGSQVGYRVSEILFGQSHVAVGRTSAVTGSFTAKGTTIEAARFTVQMGT